MSNIERAAEIISRETREFGRSANRAYDRALLAARALADAGLLADDLPAKDEWDAMIAETVEIELAKIHHPSNWRRDDDR